jgi:hypothetical protein
MTTFYWEIYNRLLFYIYLCPPQLCLSAYLSSSLPVEEAATLYTTPGMGRAKQIPLNGGY